MHTAKRVFSKGNVEVIDCIECGFKHLNPIPDQKYIDNFYKKEYFVNAKSDYYENELRDKKYLKRCFEEKLNNINKYLDVRCEKSILDIGCGSGLFLKFFRDAGWKCVGIEPSLSGISDYAKKYGITIYEDTFESVYQYLNKFSVVSLNNVLEHVVDPKKICELIYNTVLSDGGILVVTVPNDFNPLQMAVCNIYKMEPYWIAYPDHINYFDINSVIKLLTQVGFDFIDADVTFPLELFIMMGINYILNPEQGREIHKYRVNMENALDSSGMNKMKKDLYRKFYELGIGRQVTAYFTKK